MIYKLLLLAMLLIPIVSVHAEKKQNISRKFIDNLESLGVVLDRPGFHTWGTSVVQGKDKKFHMYACQWPVKYGFHNWHKESMVNYFVANKPEGPYKFVKTIVGPRPGGDKDGVWNRYTAHNPEVKRIDGYYVLTYISYPKVGAIPEAKIGMKISKKPEGPWKDVGKNGMVMQKSSVKGFPSYNSKRGTDNPSLIKYKNKYYLFYMYNPGPNDHTSVGVAISNSLKGPYIEQKSPVLLAPKGKKVEDLCVFIVNDNIVTTMSDNFGIYVANGGIYCEMDKNLFKNKKEIKLIIKSIAWDTRPRMFPKQDFSKAKTVYGANKYERPKILTINDKPAYMFLPSGVNAKGNNRTVLHAFKIKK